MVDVEINFISSVAGDEVSEVDFQIIVMVIEVGIHV